MPPTQPPPVLLSPTLAYPKRRRRRVAICAAAVALAFAALSFTGPVGSARKPPQRAVAQPLPQGRQSKKKPAAVQKGVSKRDMEPENLGPNSDIKTEVVFPPFKAETKAFALIVGVSEYENLSEKEQLRYADNDAQEMYNFLVSDKGGFQPQNVTLLLNEEATKSQVLEEIDKLGEKSGPDSLALIYFAGHGVVSKSRKAYLLPYDTTRYKLMDTAIKMADIKDAIQNLRARSVVIMSDACKAGAINDLMGGDADWSSTTNPSTDVFPEPASRRDQTSFIFTAASPTQSSVEKAEYKHGLFTYYMLEALNGRGDADGDGLVTSMELYNYVTKKIREEVVQVKVKQVPEYNPSYDRSIPLGIVSEAGQKKYLQWFGSDSLVMRLAAAFDAALQEGRLTKPQGQNALYYFQELGKYNATPQGVANEKQEKLIARLRAEAERIIEQSPADAGQWDDAQEYLGAAFQYTRDDELLAKQFYSSVKSYYIRGETGRAERECDNALEQIEKERSKDPRISVKVGQFYVELKKWDKARRAYKLAMDNNPSVPWVTEYAEVLFNLDLFPEAEEQARRALKGDPKYAPALKLLTAVLLRNPRKGSLDEALASITLARTVAPDDLEVEELFGRLMMAKGDARQAVESLLKVARLRPAVEGPAVEVRARSLLFLSRAYAQGGDLDRAISALRAAVEARSQNVEVYDALAEYLNEQGDVGEAVNVAQKAVALTLGQGEENARRVGLVAEYLERGGQLAEAAYKYREAGRIAPNAELGTSYETRARVLFLRAGRPREVGIRIISQGERRAEQRQSPLIIPGGREALERLSGIVLSEDDPTAMARVFDAALRDSTVASRLISFYTRYPDFVRKAGMKGGSNSVTLELPAAGQMLSPQAKAGLKFFGVEDKKGKRQIKPREFDAQSHILEALGGSPEKLRQGEAVKVTYKDEEISVLLGMADWVGLVKDMVKVRPEEQLLTFLQDPQAMRLYVGLSAMTDDTAAQFRQAITMKENAEDIPAGVYFAGPYLRFNPQGALYIPGQRQGELNWQRMLKAVSAPQSTSWLFKKDNGGALYLFCALSSTGEVGDFIARSPGFEQLFKSMQKSQLPVAREPFDFMDLLGYLRVEHDELRLPKAVETWVGRAGGGASDPVFALLSKGAQFPAGKQIPLVKQIAVLTQVERERPDWTANPKVVELLVRQVESSREPQIELALDLQMDDSQLAAYITRLDQLDAIQPPEAKATAVRLFQSASELLRQTVLRSDLDDKRVAELTAGLLRIDVSGSNLAPQVISFFRNELLGAGVPAAGTRLEERLTELLSAGAPVVIPVFSTQARAQAPTTGFRFDASKAAQQRINLFLSRQKLTRLSAVADAATALDELEADPSSSAALTRLRAAAETFVEPEPPPAPKKKSKQPIVQAPTFKETVARLGVPVAPRVISETRAQLAPFAGEALLGYVYAAAAPDGGLPDPGLVRRHDFGTSPWGETRLDENGKISGGVGRLSRALACGVQLAPAPDGVSRCGSDWVSTFTEATLSSVHLVRQRWITNRAGEFVVRSMDLGEDVLALSFIGEQTATQTLAQLEGLLGQRRASLIRSLVEHGEVSSASRSLTPSELYALGQLYFERLLADSSAASLRRAPGPLGTLAGIAADSQQGDGSVGAPPTELRREVRQFGAVTSAGTGLARLEFIRPEPYEYGANFREGDRLAERFYDLKLAVARRSHRSGGMAAFMLSPAVSLEVLRRALSETQKQTGGTPPPRRDWQSLMLALQSPDERAMAGFVERLAASSFTQQTPRGKWDDNTTTGAAPLQK